jgi:hypothetical protein
MAGSNKPVDLNGQVVNALPVILQPIILDLPPVDPAAYYQVMPAQPNIQFAALLALGHDLLMQLVDMKPAALYQESPAQLPEKEELDLVGDCLNGDGDFI